MSIEGQGHFFTIYFPGFVCFVLYKAKISGEGLQDHWSSGFFSCQQILSIAGHLSIRSTENYDFLSLFTFIKFFLKGFNIH